MRKSRFTAVMCAALLALAGCGGHDSRPDAQAAAARPASRFSPSIGPQSEAALNDPRAQIFLEKGCPQCHEISALGVTSPTKAGPDLTLAVSDVQSRFSTTIEEFLANPTGTMQMVLSGPIRLNPAERDSIVGLLRAIHPTNR